MTMEEKLSVSFHNCLIYSKMDHNSLIIGNKDYIVVETPEKSLNPSQMSVQHTVEIIDDDETERLHETFALDLTPITERIRVTPSLAQLTATITDDDGM